MTNNEIKEWNNLKSTCGAEAGKEIAHLAELRANHVISQKEYEEKIGTIGSASFILALNKWTSEKGYIPVMINHYEIKDLT